MKRNCEICGSIKLSKLYTQNFIISDNASSISYNIVSCKECGFTFASNIPSQKQLENFYKKNIKYAYKDGMGKIPDYTKQLHDISSKFIDKYLNKNIGKKQYSILDVGCASAHLLYRLKEKGYQNLLGIDPVPECRVVAKKLYDLNIITATLSEFKTDRKFDMVILASVLEHMINIKKVISQIFGLLKPNGFLFISVPDTQKFGLIFREPFLEFSLEHVNYFTRNSLTNLLGLSGFGNLTSQSKPIRSFGSYALDSLWKKTDKKTNFKFDPGGAKTIENYVKLSNQKLDQINKKLSELIKNQTEIFVWGAGSLTSRLLATTNLHRVKIKAFVDSNPNLHGKEINGIKIYSPKKLINKNLPVLISSYIHKSAIKKTLIEELNYKEKIILL